MLRIMKSHPRQILQLTMAAVFWMVASQPLRAQDDPDFERYRSLITRQPFMPKSGKSAGGEIASKPTGLRFTGFVISGDKVMVGIENAPQNESYLLTQGQTENGITLGELHLDQKYVTVQVNGETRRLDLVPFEPSGVAPSSGAPAFTGVPGVQGGQPGTPFVPGFQPGQTPVIPQILNPGQNQNPLPPGMSPDNQPRRRIIIPRRN